jgi:hypothetical protein
MRGFETSTIKTPIPKLFLETRNLLKAIFPWFINSFQIPNAGFLEPTMGASSPSIFATILLNTPFGLTVVTIPKYKVSRKGLIRLMARTRNFKDLGDYIASCTQKPARPKLYNEQVRWWLETLWLQIG